MKSRLWCLVLFARVHTPCSPPASQFTINDTLQESVHSQDWLQALEPNGSCPLIPTCSADLQTPRSSLHGKCHGVLFWKLGSQCLLPHYTLYGYCFIPSCPSLENEDPPNTEPDEYWNYNTKKLHGVTKTFLTLKHYTWTKPACK